MLPWAARRRRRRRRSSRTTTTTTTSRATMTPIAIHSQIRLDEVAGLADLFNPSAAATAAPLQSLAPIAGSILLLCRLFSSAGVGSGGAFGGTVNAYSLLFVATASSTSLSPIPLASRVWLAQFSGLNLEKL